MILVALKILKERPTLTSLQVVAKMSANHLAPVVPLGPQRQPNCSREVEQLSHFNHKMLYLETIHVKRTWLVLKARMWSRRQAPYDQTKMP